MDCYTASGEIVTDGVDVGVSGEITPGWQILAGYSYADTTNQATGDPMWTTFPLHLVKVSTTYDLPGDCWTVGGQLRWQSAIYAEGEDGDLFAGVPFRIDQPDYAVADLMAEYRVTERASVLLNVENLFD